MTAPPASRRGTFAQDVAQLEDDLQLGEPGLGLTILELIAGFREQQAALNAIANAPHVTTLGQAMAEARAVLAKYALEVPK